MIYLYLFGTCFHFIYVFMIIGKDYVLPLFILQHSFLIVLLNIGGMVIMHHRNWGKVICHYCIGYNIDGF